MYHSHLRFHLIGHACRVFEVIKKMPALEHFTHEFFEEGSPCEAVAGGEDIILINLQDKDIGEVLRSLNKDEWKETPIIVLESDGQKIFSQEESGEELFERITDIWTMPMTDQEIRFRFHRWQCSCRQSRELWQTSQYLEAAMNSVPNLIWYKNAEGIHEKVNDSFCQIVGKTKEQVQGRDHYYIWDVDPDDPDNEGHDCMESDWQVISRRKTCVSEETVKAGNGMKLLTTYKSPLYDLDGSVMGTVGIGIDVTQERAYEKELITKSRNLELIFTTLDCGVICHSVDGTRILNINQSALKILDYESQKELMEAGFHIIVPNVLEEDKEKLLDSMKTLKKEGDSASIGYRVRHKDGKIVHVMGNVKLIKENGELFYQRFLLDCTAQKLREEKIERHQAALVQALSIDFNLVFFFDLDTGMGMPLRIDDENSHVFEGLSLGEISLKESVECYIRKLVYEGDREMLYQALSRERLREELTEKSQYYVNYRVFKDGEIKYYEMKAVRAGAEDGNHGIVLGFRSVNEKIRGEMEQKALLEDALLQANKANTAKSVFLSNMSHDIRTPMNAIVGFTTLALSHIDNSEQVREYLGKIMISGKHMLGLINDVLDMSRIESGKMKLEEKPCALSDILHGLNNIVQADVRAKRLELHIDTVNIVDEEIYCDKLRLNQVLLNVLSNAVKYTNAGGAIRLTLTEKASDREGVANYEFSVKDTGIGMSKEFIPHIFDSFERENNTTISGIQGTGLGMAITKNIVDMMKGNIEVDSEQGKGTEVILSFSFRFVPKEKGRQEIPELAGCRALTVGADPSTFDRVSYLLGRFGMRVEGAGVDAAPLNIRQAHMQGEGYRLYLIDWRLPDMDVAEVVRKLAKEAKGEGDIIVMTAYDWSDIEEDAKAAGVSAFCSKPLFFSGLRNCLCSLVDSEKRTEGMMDKESLKKYSGRILLAEDNELNQEIATAILGDAGFSTEIAGNGKIAVEMIKNSTPGYYKFVLMDVQMPVMNGYEATKEIRKLENKELAAIPILAMTANAFEEDRQEALNCGMNEHIAKPIDVEKLFEVLERELG